MEIVAKKKCFWNKAVKTTFSIVHAMFDTLMIKKYCQKINYLKNHKCKNLINLVIFGHKLYFEVFKSCAKEGLNI